MQDIKKLKLIVAVAAYEAEKNILRLLGSISTQKLGDSYEISKIIVHCDSSADKTAELAESVNNPKISIIKPVARLGYAGSMQNIFKQVDKQTDVLITLNDDILIKDSKLITKLVEPILSDSQVALVCGRAVSLPPKNFVQRTIAMAEMVRFKERVAKKLLNSSSYVDGKAMVFNMRQFEEFVWPSDLSLMGCVDSYMYLWTKQNRKQYKLALDVEVYSKIPNTWKECLDLQIRHHYSTQSLLKTFGSLVAQEYPQSGRPELKYYYLEILFRPFNVAALFLFNKWVARCIRRLQIQNFDVKWDTITSTKSI